MATTTTRRKPAAKKPAAKKTTTPKQQPVVDVSAPAPLAQTTPLTEAQRQAKLEAYHALTAAGLDVPRELATEVEAWLADLQAARELETQRLKAEAEEWELRVSEANQNGPWFVRNGYPAPFNIRLDRQTEQRRIQLQPRGKPGDLHPIKDEDLKDPILRQNLALGLIEVVPAGEAQLIIEKQTTNMSHRVHTPLAILRNELGHHYEQGAVKVEAEFNSQGVTVATVDPRILQGQAHDREIGGVRAGGGLTRVHPGQEVAQTPQGPQGPQQATSVVHSGFVPTGGNQAIIQYGPTGDNARAQIADDIARRKNIQGPQAGLPGDIQVVVDPVRRT